MLTGKPTKFIKFREDGLHPDIFWDELIDYDEKRYPMGCSIGFISPDCDLRKVGLWKRHAYSIMKVKQLKNGIRLIQLRNPHARNSGIGNWSGVETPSKWTAEYLSEINSDETKIKTDHDQGIFWIQYEDFIKYFTRAFICIDDPTLNVKREQKFKIKSTELNVFDLTVTNPDIFYIKVYCDRARDVKKDSDLFLMLFKEETERRFYQKHSHPLNALTSEMCIKLESGIYRIVPLSFKDFFNRSLKNEDDSKFYNLVIHSKQKIFLKKTKVDWMYGICINEICYHHSNIKIGSPQNWDPEKHKFFKIISTKEGKAYILASNPEYDVLFFVAYNRNFNKTLHIKLNVNPNTYIGKAELKDKKKIEKMPTTISFDVFEKLNISCLGKHLETSSLSLNHKVVAFDDRVLCIVHRYIEDPKVAFKRHCENLSINAEDFTVNKNLDHKDFNINLISAVFI